MEERVGGQFMKKESSSQRFHTDSEKMNAARAVNALISNDSWWHGGVDLTK